MNQLKDNKSLTFVVILISVLVLASSLLVIIFVIFYPFSPNEPSSSQTYQFFETSHRTSRSTYGFVSLNRKLSDEEFISYPNRDSGIFTIISNFGTTQYECTGLCYCETDPTTRRTATVLTRSLTLLFSAISTSLALSVAKESFKDHCIDQFSSDCDPSQIVEEVTMCSKKKKKKRQYEYPYGEEPWTDEEEEEEEAKRKRREKEEAERLQKEEEERLKEKENDYMCVGHCLKNWFFIPRIQATGKFPQIKEKYGECTQFRSTGKVKGYSMLNAKANFCEKVLDPYCKSSSYMSFKFMDDTDLDDPFEYFRQKQRGNLLKKKEINWQIAVCVGTYGKYKNQDGVEVPEDEITNDHVNCVPGGFLKV